MSSRVHYVAVTDIFGEKKVKKRTRKKVAAQRQQSQQNSTTIHIVILKPGCSGDSTSSESNCAVYDRKSMKQ